MVKIQSAYLHRIQPNLLRSSLQQLQNTNTCKPVCKLPSEGSFCSHSYKSINIANRLLTRWHWLKRLHSHLPIVHRAYGKKCFQWKPSHPLSFFTPPATRTVGGVYRKVISFSSHCRHTEGDGEGKSRRSGREVVAACVCGWGAREPFFVFSNIQNK